jgi:hypothetical protein
MKQASIKLGDIVYRTDADFYDDKSDTWYWQAELARLRGDEPPPLPKDIRIGTYVGDSSSGLSPLCPYMGEYHHLIRIGEDVVVVSERNFVAPEIDTGRLQHFRNTEVVYLDDYLDD